MIVSFGNRLAEDLFHDRQSKEVRRLPANLVAAARRKIHYLHDVEELRDLRAVPGNRMKSLQGRLKGFHSVRINDQWRLVFRWKDGRASDVAVVDYH